MVLVLIAFLLVTYFITHKMSNRLDKQVVNMIMGFLKEKQPLDTNGMKSNVIYAEVYRLLPPAFALGIVLGVADKGIIATLYMGYIIFQVLKSLVGITVLFNIPSKVLAEKLVKGYKES